MGTKQSLPLHPPSLAVDPAIKCVISGEGGVGKSMLVRTIVTGQFVDEYDPTIEDVWRKQVKIDEMQSTVIDFLDMAGQEEFSCMTEQWFREADIVLFCFSINNLRSLEAIPALVERLERVKDLAFTPTILVGCKADLDPQRQVSQREARAFQARLRALSYVETSAKAATNLVELTKAIIDAMQNSSPHVMTLRGWRAEAKLQLLALRLRGAAQEQLSAAVGEGCALLIMGYVPFSLSPLTQEEATRVAAKEWTKVSKRDEAIAETEALKEALAADRTYVDLRIARNQQRVEYWKHHKPSPPRERIRCVDGRGRVERLVWSGRSSSSSSSASPPSWPGRGVDQDRTSQTTTTIITTVDKLAVGDCVWTGLLAGASSSFSLACSPATREHEGVQGLTRNWATITAVFSSVIEQARPLVTIDGVRMTRYHPVQQGGHWQHAKDVAPPQMEHTIGYRLYNFELDRTHSIAVNGLVVATLGCDVGHALRSSRPDLDREYGLGWWDKHKSRAAIGSV